MQPDPGRRRTLIGGIWLVGLGLLFATRFWWPGIMFLVAFTAFVTHWLNNQPWYGFQSAFWLTFIGVWALARYSLVFLLIGLGASAIIGALVKPGPFTKPKPFVDSSLE